MADWVANWRTGEFEIFINKNETIWLFNKFYMKAEVKKDDQSIMTALLTTNEKPYKMSLNMPAFLNRIRPDMDKYEVTVNHDPQMLEVITNDRKWFRGLKISQMRNPNERELEFNGKKFILTENSLKTKDDSRLESMMKITWQGSLPNNTLEAEAFLLENRLSAEVKGSRRNFEANLGWKMDKPKFDLSLPWNGKMDFNTTTSRKTGDGKWGTNYNISGEVAAALANKIIQLAVIGEASFTRGFFAQISPVSTDVDVNYLIDDKDLVGKFSTVMKGYEYSIAFPNGSSVEPEVTWGRSVRN